jgi:hypothetical protein
MPWCGRPKREGCEVFLYTDNQTAERAYSKGMAGSRSLFELIVLLYKLQMEFDFILRVIWIAGTRMIQQGTDGLSPGEDNGLATCELSLGGMAPLHLDAIERSPTLKDWIRDWWSTGRELLMTEPRDWFTTSHTPGDFEWFPAWPQWMRPLISFVRLCTKGLIATMSSPCCFS